MQSHIVKPYGEYVDLYNVFYFVLKYDIHGPIMAVNGRNM